MTYDDLKKAALECLGDGAVENSREHQMAIVMMIGHVGVRDVEEIVDTTGFDRKDVTEWRWRILTSGLWEPAEWDRWMGEDGGVTFVISVSVVDGLMEVETAPTGERRYRLTDKGTARAAALVKEAGGSGPKATR